jgi:hypothetical protein
MDAHPDFVARQVLVTKRQPTQPAAEVPEPPEHLQRRSA